MHKIDAPGATVDNLFTEGNPSLGIPATEVSDDWLNDVQGEIVNVIEGQSIALVKGDDTQLNTAILNMIGAGGTGFKLDPLANNTASQDITGLIFDKTLFTGAVLFYEVHRRTDSSNEQESGLALCKYDPEDDVWRITKLVSGFDDAGVTFDIQSTGQVRASTDDLAGSSYDGQIRFTSVVRFAI